MMPLPQDLLSRLQRHAPANPTEAGYRARMLALLDGPADPCARASFTPGHFTASAFVLSPDRAHLLLILHSKLGLWLQPGGHIDPADPDIVAAARREAREETGIDAFVTVPEVPGLLDLDIHPIPANLRKGEPAHQHFDVRIALQATTWDFAAGSDASAARWVALSEVQDAGTDDSVRRALRTLCARIGAAGV